MKNLFLFTLLIISYNAYAQEVYVANKYCVKKDSAMLFEDGNNIIQVYVPGMKADELKMKSMDRSLRIADPQMSGDTLTMMAMPFATGRKLKLDVFNKKTNKLIKEVSFNASKLPEPHARLGTVKDTIVNKAELLSQSSLSVVFPGSLYGYPYRIISYKFRAVYNGKTATLSVDGYWLTTAVLREIHDAPVGALIEFSEVKAICPECNVRILPDLRIHVK